jgi:hypothetical protein
VRNSVHGLSVANKSGIREKCDDIATKTPDDHEEQGIVCMLSQWSILWNAMRSLEISPQKIFITSERMEQH